MAAPAPPVEATPAQAPRWDIPPAPPAPYESVPARQPERADLDELDELDELDASDAGDGDGEDGDEDGVDEPPPWRKADWQPPVLPRFGPQSAQPADGRPPHRDGRQTDR